MRLGVVFYILYFCACLCITTACGEPTEEAVLSAEELDVEVETTSDVELIYSDSAIVSVIVKATTMLTNTKRGNQKQEFPDGVEVDFFDQNGRVQSELRCNKATRYERDKKIVMQDSVVWKSAKGEILDTEELVWDERAEQVYSKRFVKITTKTDVINGYGFEADQGFTKWKIIRPQGEMGIKDVK